jgi:hypothetical protein
MKQASMPQWRKAEATTRQFATLALIAALCACMPVSSPSAGSESREGLQYRDALVKMIRRSDRIVVTEHSDIHDAFDPERNGDRDPRPKEIVYREITLSSEQRSEFASSIERLDPKTQDAFAACIFSPHHTIDFYSNGRRISVMKICFECSQVEWDGSRVSPPWALYAGLARFIATIGLSPERDWDALAERYRR